MTCYHPIRACYSKSGYARTGKKDVHLVMSEHFDENNNVIKDSHWLYNEKSFPHALYEYINIPCRVCVGCRSDNAKMWSMRAFHELQCHDESCFITLTYSDTSDLVVRSEGLCTVDLNYKHFQNFMKRLRKRFPDKDIGYLVSGEYGTKDGRAHWHAILYGINFSEDRTLVFMKKGFRHYDSQILRECWSTYDRQTDTYNPIGFVDLADVDYDCCAYVAGYVLKKLPIDYAEPVIGHYFDVNTANIEDIKLSIEGRCPPIIRSSKRPAIGLSWYNKYGKNACEKGFAVVPKGSKKMKIKTPSYYYSKFEKDFPEQFTKLKEERENKMKEYYNKNPVDEEKLSIWEQGHFYRIKKRLKDVLTAFTK